MIKNSCIILVAVFLLSCDSPVDNMHNLSRLPCNRKLINATSESNTGRNFLTRPMTESDVAEEYILYTNSNAITIKECKAVTTAPPVCPPVDESK